MLRLRNVQPRFADHRLRRAHLCSGRLPAASRLAQLADHPAGDHRRWTGHALQGNGRPENRPVPAKEKMKPPRHHQEKVKSRTQHLPLLQGNPRNLPVT